MGIESEIYSAGMSGDKIGKLENYEICSLSKLWNEELGSTI